MGGWLSSPVEADMDGAQAKEVEALVKGNEIVIFSKTYCPYCTMAKKVFESINKDFKCIELDKRNDGNVIQAILGKMTGASTVPRVFIKGNCVGGGTDVKKLHEDGKLIPLLA